MSLASRGWRLAALVGLCLGVGSSRSATGLTALASAAAQAAQPPQPTFRTEAHYVRVDAFSTRDGAPVGALTQSDFDVLEDRVPQRIEQFERVVVRGNLPQDLRAEPNTVAESRQAVQNPRARVFVVFLDTGHVDAAGSHN